MRSAPARRLFLASCVSAATTARAWPTKGRPGARGRCRTRFYPLAGKLLPWLWAIAALLAAVAGLVVGLVVAPTDFQQGDAYRIIFIHVPAAWMSMLIYLVMAFWAAVGLVLNTRLSSMMARRWRPPAR
jgi:ABC-type transport system involved in cytochrome c biogenesis permease subunit